MPLYEYRCLKCRKNFEKIRKFSDPPLTTCEECGGTLEQLLSSPAIQFKGSGWYVTDYARKSPSAEPVKAESSSAKTETSSSSDGKKSVETSPAAKSNESKPPSKK